MKKLIAYLYIILLITACTNNTTKENSGPPPLFSTPKITVVKSCGYIINVVTGDSILPVINSFGDTIQTGIPLPILGKVINPDSVRKPIKRKTSQQKITHNNLKIHVVPKDITVIKVNKDSLKRLNAGDKIDCSACLSDIGDTIPTGIAINVKGRVIPSVQPQAIKAGLPEYKHNASYNIQILGSDQGLSVSYVMSILEDKMGNIWIASKSGVSKYNGETFMHYGEKEGLSNSVYSVLEDKNGNIWFGTSDKGVCMYNGETFTFYSEKEGLSSNYVYSLFEDKRGNIWIGSSQGVSKLTYSSVYGAKQNTDSSNKVTLTNYTKKEGFIKKTVRGIIEDKYGNMWFSSWGGGVCMFNAESLQNEKEKITITHYTQKDGMASDWVNEIIEDKKGDIWFATGEGVSKLVRETKDGVEIETITNYTEKEGLSGNTVYGVKEDNDGNIWFGSYAAGLSKLSRNMENGNEVEIFTNYYEEDGFSTNDMGVQLIDKSGNIWINAWGTGVNIIKSGSFKNYTRKDGLPYDRVYSVLEDKEGDIWFGTDGGGAQKMILGGVESNDVNSIINYPTDRYLKRGSFYSMLKDNDGNIWFTNSRGWIVMLTQNSEKKSNNKEFEEFITFYSSNQGLVSSRIRIMIEDHYKNIWIGQTKGMSKLINRGPTKGNITHYTEKEGLSDNAINSILEDRDGDIWIATNGGGVSKLTQWEEDGIQKEVITHYTEKEGLCNNFVNVLLEDKEGNIWLGTDFGLDVLNLGRKADSTKINFTHYTSKEGLSNNIIQSLVEDNNGHIWATTKSGLNELIFEENIDGKNTRSTIAKEIRNYGKYDGLKGTDFIGKSAYLDSKNRMWLGSTKGLNMLDMDQLTSSQNLPKIHLSSININERYIDFHNLKQNDSTGFSYNSTKPFYNYPENLILDYDKNHLTFHFYAIDWQAPHKIQYSYLLEGLNENWSKTSKEAKVDYRNIPYGSYTFKVSAIGESGEWNEPFEYEFTINPPWWHTWRARMAYALILLLGILLFHYWRTASYKKREKDLEDKIDSATLEIRAQKEEAEIQRFKAEKSEESKQQFLANMSHEIRTPMNAIMGMTDILLRRKPKTGQMKYLEGIKDSSDSLLVIINDILDLSKIEVGKIDLESIPFSISEVVQSVQTIMQFKAEEKGLVLKLDIPDNIQQIIGDPMRLRQVIINLVGNAVKFTDKGIVTTSLKIETQQDGTNINAHFTISDTGIGIEKDKLEQVFNSFEQAYADTSRKFGGTGLGLSISKKLIELQHGKIWAESKKGKGSQFHFTIPYQVSYEQKDTEVVSITTNIESISNKLKGLKVLLVEDNAFNAVVAQEELEDAILDTSVVVAENGAIAVEQISHNDFDVVLMDVQMPVMNGYEATKAIRDLDVEKSKIPIIAMTANVMKEEVELCYKAGMNDFIGKPFDTEDLIQKIYKLIHK